MKKKVLRDLVLIKADKPKDQTESGIFLVEEWKSYPPTGIVLAVGPQVEEARPGDKVLFERYGSIILEDDERMCKESHLLAIVHEAE